MLPRIRSSDRRTATLVDAPPGWLAAPTLLRTAEPSGAPLDMALAFVHGYSWLKDDPAPDALHREMAVAAYRRNLAIFKRIIADQDPKLQIADTGASILLKLVDGSEPYARLLSGSSEQTYAHLLLLLGPDAWPVPAAPKDHLLTEYPTLEASYKLELGREPETWTWLDKWRRALFIDPIARTLMTGQDSPTRKRARKLLLPKSKELTQVALIDAFIGAWRAIHQLRSTYITDTGKTARKSRERREELARDLLTLVLTDNVREVFYAVGLWPALQYCIYVEAWWFYIEHLAVRCALPLDEIHYSLNSTVAVALLEAMTGDALPAPGHSSYLNAHRHAKQEDDESSSARIDQLPVWVASTTDKTWAALWTLAMEAMKRPFVLRSSLARLEPAGVKKEKEAPVTRADVALDDMELARHWPRYPQTHQLPKVTNDAWDPTGERFSIYKHSRYSAQLKLFVAASIAAHAVLDLGLPAPILSPLVPDKFNKTQKKAIKIHWDRSDDPDRPMVPLEEKDPLLETTTPEMAAKEELEEDDVTALNEDRDRYLQAVAERVTTGLISPLRLVAGSLPWGGRKLPHITHRDGLTFDLQMGADSQRWPLINAAVTKHLHGVISINWSVVLEVLARSNRASGLTASTLTHAPGEGKKLKGMTLREVQLGYRQAVARYQLALKALEEPPDLPLPLSAASRKVITRLAVQLHRAKKTAESRALYDLVVITTLGEKIARRAVADPLILRHSSQEVDAFNGRSRRLLFRGLVTDVLVQPMLARIEAIVRHTLVEQAKEPDSWAGAVLDVLAKGNESALEPAVEWQEIERRWQDLPLAHTPAGVHRGLIATVALLLSGMRELIFGSPVLFARAMRILEEAARDDVTVANALLSCAGRVVDAKPSPKPEARFALTTFAFMPHNHSDHHHVQYGIQGYGEMYARDSTDWSISRDLAELEPMLTVWLDLGIDLRPFSDYLEAQQGSTEGMPTAMAGERDAVKRLVSQYVSDYMQRFVLHRATNPTDAVNAAGYARFAIARGRLYDLLMRTNEPHMYAAKPPEARGTELDRLSNDSIAVMHQLRDAINFRAIKEYLDALRKRGLMVVLEADEVWEDDLLAEIAKSLKGPERFRERLQQVIDFTVAEPRETVEDDETDVTPEEAESDLSSEFEEEEEFRRAVLQEILERRTPANP